MGLRLGILIFERVGDGRPNDFYFNNCILFLIFCIRMYRNRYSCMKIGDHTYSELTFLYFVLI